jgi:hypothetical protein
MASSVDVVLVFDLHVAVDDFLTALPKLGTFHAANAKVPPEIRWDYGVIHRKFIGLIARTAARGRRIRRWIDTCPVPYRPATCGTNRWSRGVIWL